MKQMFLVFVTAFLLVVLVVPAGKTAETNADNIPSGDKGKRPYEMDWAGRIRDNRQPLVGFQDLTGWRVECTEGVSAALSLTQQQLLFGEYTAKLAYTGCPGGVVTIRPPKPINLPDDYDCVNIWIHGNNWEWAPDPKTPRVDVALLIIDSLGNEHEIPLVNVRWMEWWLVHKKLTMDVLEKVRGGRFNGIVVRNVVNKEERAIFLNNLVFYKEDLKPLTFTTRPARGVKMFPGQPTGLNTGPSKLPFPTREQTILPMQLGGSFRNSLRIVNGKSGSEEFHFNYEGKDGRVEYVWAPEKGGPETITARIAGVQIHPMSGAGVVFDTPRTVRFQSYKKIGDAVRALYDAGGQQVEWCARIWQKSLVIDCISVGRAATGLSFGRFEGLESPRIITTPFLTLGAGNPGILMAKGKQGNFFGSIWLDWYRSNGSEPYSDTSLEPGNARINGGVRYHAKTDGKRNDLYERIFLTLTPTFEEVYPTVDNPQAKMVKEAGRYLWQESWGPENYKKEMERSAKLASYGIKNLIQCNHEITWRDGGESFTLRTRSAPGRGGDDALKEYVAHQKSLGWRSGLYTNYTDYAPVNEHWDENAVQLEANGEWRPAWPRNYALKPSRAVGFDAELAKKIQTKFGTNAAYTDVMTAVAPWGYNDYDARVPGAGAFASTFYAYGQLLLNDQDVYGIVHSEGTYHWMYAGLATGNYGLCYTGVDPQREPLNVAFDLYQIHSREADIGMPWTDFFFRNASGWDKPENIDASIDHFLAATIAYGHLGWLVEEKHGIQRTCRSYYMLQPVTSLYAGETPKIIQYADASGTLHSASSALAGDFFKLSRLHVEFANGLQVYINGSQTNWEVKTPRGHVVLPEWGWVAWSRNGQMYTASCLEIDHRADYSKSLHCEYLDGRGQLTRKGTLAAFGAVARRGSELIDIDGNKEIGFQADSSSGYCVIAISPDGKELKQVSTRVGQNNYFWFDCVEGARTYRIEPAKAALAKITSKQSFAVPGERVKVSMKYPNKTTRNETVNIPSNARPKEHLWVSLGEDAIDFDIVDPVTISLGRMLPVKRGGLTVPVRLFTNVRNAGDPKLSVEEAQNLKATVDKSGRVVHLIPNGKSGDSASLTLTARCGAFTSKKRLEFVLEDEYPVAIDLLGPENVWGWATVSRTGTVTPVDNASGAQWLPEKIISGGVAKRGIFSHPPYIGKLGCVYGDTQPFKVAEGGRFHTYIGLKDGGDLSDGVTFSVWVLEQGKTPQKVVEKMWPERRWTELSVDLTLWAGKVIALRLMADVGPADNSTADWASWGEPSIQSSAASLSIKLKQ